MKNRKINLFIGSVVGVFASYFFLKIFECGNTVFCYGFETKMLGVFYGFLALSVIFLVLLFLPRAFNAWKKFAVWFIPLAALLFIFYPDPGSGDYFSPYPEQVFQWVSVIYVLISLGIIGYQLTKKH